jgi:catechol 2,3-dioxygenase-like lactoylglutathione lyase family enzyme
MHIQRIHHVQITVPIGAESQARDFYCTTLGLHEIDKPDSLKPRGGLWVAIGDQQVHIGVEHDANRSATKAHIAYEVDDLSAWRTSLTHAGLTVNESISISGYDRLEFRDPFGNRVELIQPHHTSR